MPARLTNEQVDGRLINRNIRRLTEYVNSYTQVEWECIPCGHKWFTKLSNILDRNTGCPKCSNCFPLTNEDIDQKLVGRNIKRVDSITNVDTPLAWRCLVCDHTWNTSPANILNRKTGCPKCAGNIRLTNDSVDQQLVGRNITRIDDIVNSHRKIQWKCLLCNNEWSSSPTNILNNKSGCPNCFKTTSAAENQWLDSVGVPDTPLNRQVPINLYSKRFIVDGYIPETNTVYEFWGDFWHGNPQKHNRNDINPKTQTLFGELYDKTQQRRTALLNAGYNLVEIWESDWNNNSLI